MRFTLSLVLFVVDCLIGVCASTSVAASDARVPVVDTYAGSGISGLRDGTRLRAEFVTPAGLAVDSSGRVYVADRGAQRIKMIDGSGNVHTIAGSGAGLGPALGVAGGYRDGPAISARFNLPLAVAAASNGDVYVADTKNHCIRLIRNGIVTTVAGAPSRMGAADGDASAASFTEPRSIALGSDGTLYVADFPNGVRVVAPNGSVKTLPVQQSGSGHISSVALVSQNGNEYLLATSASMISEINLRTDERVFQMKIVASPSWDRDNIAFGMFVGPPAAIAGFPTPSLVAGSMTIVYADALYSGIVICYAANCRFLSHPPSFNASLYGGGFQDGNPATALFDQPEGIAVGSNGSIFVADTGNKRIRRITGVPAIMPGVGFNESILSKFPATRKSGEYRIAIIGNSSIDAVLPPEEGIAADLERQLSPILKVQGKHLQVYPLGIGGISPGALIQAIRENLSEGLADVVIFDLPVSFDYPMSLSADKSFPERWDPSWIGSTGATLRQLTATLQSAGITLYILAHPLAFEIPGESVYAQFPKVPPDTEKPGVHLDDELHIVDPSDVARISSAVAQLAKDPHLRFIDFYPAFFHEHASANSHRLYGSWDNHFTPYGASLIAKGLADRLKQDAPWVRH
jgi:serine/threonine-protein kinase